jgi:hypothetical protein
MGWFLLAGALVAVGIVGGLGVRSRSSRQRALVQLCANAGLSYAVLDPFPDTTLLPFRVFGWGSAHGVENIVLHGTDDHAIRVFDLWVEPTPGQARRTMTCGVVPLPFGAPPIAVLPRGQYDPSEEPVMGDVVHLELDAFERRFEVRAVDPRAAVALLDQRMMAALLRLPMRSTSATTRCCWSRRCSSPAMSSSCWHALKDWRPASRRSWRASIRRGRLVVRTNGGGSRDRGRRTRPRPVRLNRAEPGG